MLDHEEEVLPIYGTQTKLIIRMIALHGEAGPRGLALANYFATVQEPETRIDVVRAAWNEKMADTERLLDALAATSAAPGRPALGCGLRGAP